MMKKLKHTWAIALLIGFAIIAMGSMESSPSTFSGSSGSGGGGSSPTQFTYTFSNRSSQTVIVDIERSSYTIQPNGVARHVTSNPSAAVFYVPAVRMVVIDPFTVEFHDW